MRKRCLVLVVLAAAAAAAVVCERAHVCFYVLFAVIGADVSFYPAARHTLPLSCDDNGRHSRRAHADRRGCALRDGGGDGDVTSAESGFECRVRFKMSKYSQYRSRFDQYQYSASGRRRRGSDEGRSRGLGRCALRAG